MPTLGSARNGPTYLATCYDFNVIVLAVGFIGFLRWPVSDCIVVQRVDKTFPPKPLGMDFFFFESIQVGMQYFTF